MSVPFFFGFKGCATCRAYILNAQTLSGSSPAQNKKRAALATLLFGARDGTWRLLRLCLAYLWLADRRKRQYPAHRSSLKAVRRTVFLRSDPLGFKPRSK